MTVRLAVRCEPELADRVLAELLILAPSGLEETEGEGWVEYALYGAEGELPDLGELPGAVGDGVVAVRAEQVEDGWEDRWREHHRPVVVGERLRIRPPWSEPAAPGLLDVVIDPGRAFGTGAHPSTRLCLELLLELEVRGLARGALADWGTGSGVLAIAAALLGFGPVTACDSEQAAVEEASAASEANGVAVEVVRCDLRSAAPPPAPTVVANLVGPLLRALADRMAGTGVTPLSAPEVLICSGLLATEADGVAAGLARAGLVERERRIEGEWAAILACR